MDDDYDGSVPIEELTPEEENELLNQDDQEETPLDFEETFVLKRIGSDRDAISNYEADFVLFVMMKTGERLVTRVVPIDDGIMVFDPMMFKFNNDSITFIPYLPDMKNRSPFIFWENIAQIGEVKDKIGDEYKELFPFEQSPIIEIVMDKLIETMQNAPTSKSVH